MREQLQSTGRGIDYLLIGLRRLPEPGILSHVIIPLTVNIIVFATMIWYAVKEFSNLVDAMVGWLPDWLSFLSFLAWPVFAFALAILMYFTFTLVANFIAAPFNGFLAERIQNELDPGCVPDAGFKELMKMIPRTIVRELQRLAYYLPRAIVLIILTFIPLVGFVTPVLWFLFSAWMLGLQYSDYAADNELYNFQETKARLATPRLQTMMFGGLTSVLTLIPIVNLVLMPAAVIGGTYLWVERRGPRTL
ncbi:sulfate transporter CysZ [Parendozoicomonas haliclonae]|uniref:Sulfate transporter CysZ n=1 Tax=Parendozoicomonas haliclonae TaxID=1960125 RepID=A0A1X7ARU2_9GAMM|nr:sulfate transporter CysZ [Parendozoicomonas haliclonae]SMA50127.1 putative sulfate transport protein CysZ [Parendozoicomonas haliclonae]